MVGIETKDNCERLRDYVLEDRNLVFISNRGPFSFVKDASGDVSMQRSGGGLVTALLSLANQVKSTWIACAHTDEDREWKQGEVQLDSSQETIQLKFINPDVKAYEQYYQVIANPLLWFLQHLMWDFSYSPTLNKATWQAWDEGYRVVNELFADEVVKQVKQESRPAIIMFHDYHLYLAPRIVRNKLRRMKGNIITHFIHIPWPGPEDWGLLPGKMREAILDGLCAADLIGFQTQGDALNFIRTCENLLPGARVNFHKGRVMLHNHVTHVRDFPISIDVKALMEQANSEEVSNYRSQFIEQFQGCKLIVRIDRTEPSKNIVRGFQAYDEMLDTHPEHLGRVQFVAIMVPSRLDVQEYHDYLNEIMAAAGSVNAKHGSSDWEPVRVLVGESFPRAVAAMQLYDVLLVNPVADGMNLVSKEGPVVNQKNGILVLSERAGAHQQLGDYSLVIAPCDVSATAEALHTALMMPKTEKRSRSKHLKVQIENEDIFLWLCWQLDEVNKIISMNHLKEN